MQHLSTESTSLATAEFIAKCSDMMIPLRGSLAYFSVVPLDERESERLIFDPTSAFPPRVSEIIPKLRLVLVPYLESSSGPDDAETGVRIAFQPPADSARRYAEFEKCNGASYLFIAVRDEELFDAHILLYRTLAGKLIDRAGPELAQPFYDQVDSELDARAHGEVHELAWRCKQDLLSYSGDRAGRLAALADYRRQALEDTLTLYLHGLCCDLELEPGPKQLASKYIRKRLLLLKDQLPPPDGVALFPEELSDA